MIKHIEGISDEDTIQAIQENVYMQYFVGLPQFQTQPAFVPSLFMEIRKRLGKKGSQQLNDMLLKQARQLRAIKHRAKPKKKDGDQGGNKLSGLGQTRQGLVQRSQAIDHKDRHGDKLSNKGTLKMDATVAPQHIGYPTDTRLLHEARIYSEALIDKLY